MSSVSPWKQHWLKGLNSDPKSYSSAKWHLMLMSANSRLSIYEEIVDTYRLFQRETFIMYTATGRYDITGNSSTKHIALVTDVNVWYTVFGSGNSPMLVYTVKSCFLIEDQSLKNSHLQSTSTLLTSFTVHDPGTTITVSNAVLLALEF